MGPAWSSSPHWGTFWGQFEIELAGGIISAYFFLFLILFFFKPKVRIASFLCRVPVPSGESHYIFKFANRSFFHAHDIRVELLKLRKIPMGGSGEFNNDYRKLNLINSEISHIPARTTVWRKNKANPHCIIVRSNDDIDTILKEELNAIMLRVSLKHGLTGLSNVFEHEYANIENIKTGKFKPGTRFEII